MPEQYTVKVRYLPDGGFLEARDAGWENTLFRVDLAGSEDGFARGALVEIESGPMLYLGEVQQCSESGFTVRVEHSLDRQKLASIQNTWA
ncbi:MAG: hypothetical protein WB579_20080 [Bryobacteraceae bacterium]